MSTDTGFSLAQFPALRGSGNAAQEGARGHAAGYAAGLRAAEADTAALRSALREEHDALERRRRAELDEAIAVLRAAARALNDATVPVVSDSQEVLVASALELTEAIVGHELADAEGSARAALARVLDRPIATVHPVVRMNPDDLIVLAPQVRANAEITFVPDPELSRGDAIAEFPDGFLDARIGTALERAKAVLLPGAS